MKRSNIWMQVAVMLGLALWVGSSLAATVRPLSEQEGFGRLGATHVVTFTHADLTTATTNTAQTITNAFAIFSNSAVELVYSDLIEPFTDDATNVFNSVLVDVGDGDDTDFYLMDMEVNSYGSEAYLAYGRSVSNQYDTLVVVTQLVETGVADLGTGITLYTDTILDFLASNTYTVVTHVTFQTASVATNYTTRTSSSVTDSSITSILGKKVYTANDTIDFIFTPSPVSHALADLDNGEVRFYFRVLHGWDNQ